MFKGECCLCATWPEPIKTKGIPLKLTAWTQWFSQQVFQTAPTNPYWPCSAALLVREVTWYVRRVWWPHFMVKAWLWDANWRSDPWFTYTIPRCHHYLDLIYDLKVWLFWPLCLCFKLGHVSSSCSVECYGIIIAWRQVRHQLRHILTLEAISVFCMTLYIVHILAVTGFGPQATKQILCKVVSLAGVLFASEW